MTHPKIIMIYRHKKTGCITQPVSRQTTNFNVRAIRCFAAVRPGSQGLNSKLSEELP